MKTSITEIAQHVCSCYDIGIADIKSQSRKQDIVDARHAIVMLGMKYEHRLEQIALFINRNRSATSYYLNDRPLSEFSARCITSFVPISKTKDVTPRRTTNNCREYKSKYNREERFMRIAKRPRVTVTNNIR